MGWDVNARFLYLGVIYRPSCCTFELVVSTHLGEATGELVVKDIICCQTWGYLLSIFYIQNAESLTRLTMLKSCILQGGSLQLGKLVDI